MDQLTKLTSTIEKQSEANDKLKAKRDQEVKKLEKAYDEAVLINTFFKGVKCFTKANRCSKSKC